MVIHPVLMPAPVLLNRLQNHEKMQILGSTAEKALACSAGKSGVVLGLLKKNANGAPQPNNGCFWSLAHAIDYVAAVTAPFPIGIDIEKIASFTPALQKQIALTQEWDLVDQVTPLVFFRFWTAKEAVLKATGVGLSGLPNCVVTEVVDHETLRLRYQTEIWTVSHCMPTPRHIAAVTSGISPIVWHVGE
jgi:4'-phosphopantetheinyl transferase